MQDKAGDYPAAIRNLKLYLLAAPGASDAKAVETLIYKIEFKQEKAAKDTTPKTGKPPMEGSEQNEWLAGLDGAVYQLDFPDKILQKEMQHYATFRIRGKEVSWERVLEIMMVLGGARWHAQPSKPIRSGLFP